MTDVRPDPMGPVLEGQQHPLGRLLGHSITYALGGLAYKAVALVSVPILARLLTPAELGALDLAVVVAIVVSMVGTVGLDTALARLDAERGNSAALWASALAVMAVGLAITAGITVGLSSWLARMLLADPGSADIITAAAGYGCALAITTLGLNAIRLRGKPLRYAAYGFVIVLGEMVSALALAAAGMPTSVIVLGWLAVSLVGGLILVVRELPSFGRPSMVVSRRLIAFGLPLIPAAIAWTVADLLARGFVSDRLGLTALGEYGIAGRVTSILPLLVTGFGLAWHPFLYRSDVADGVMLARRAAVQLIAALGIVAITLAAVAPEVIGLVAGEAYVAGAVLVAPLGLGMVAFGLISLAAALSGLRYRTREIAIATVFGAIVQVAFAPLLIEQMGLAGVGVALAFGYALALAAIAAMVRLLSPSVVLVAAVVAAGLMLLGAIVEAEFPIRLLAGGLSILVIAASWRATSAAAGRVA